MSGYTEDHLTEQLGILVLDWRKRCTTRAAVRVES